MDTHKLHNATNQSIRLQTSRTATSLQQANAEIARMNAILQQIEDLEMEFDKMTAAVFAASSQYATEAVGAFRTVLSLNLGDVISDRYNSQLSGHVKKAFNKAKWGTLIFAASDSAEMGCTALAFWYVLPIIFARTERH